MQFSSYSYNESKERTSKLNKLLDKLKIETVPDISAQALTSSTYQQTPYQSSVYNPRQPVYSEPRPVVIVEPPKVYNEPSSRTSSPVSKKRSISLHKEVEMTTPNIIEDKEEHKEEV
jgi:hypothetical protein